MSKILRCDLCGKVEEQPDSPFVSVKVTHANRDEWPLRTSTADLCGTECLLRWTRDLVAA